MVRSTRVSSQRVLVLGLGLFGGGASAARWFAERGARVTATDLRSRRALQPTLRRLRGLPIRYVLSRHRAADIRAADLIVRNPAIPNGHPLLALAERLGVPVEGDAALCFSLCAAPIVGITGSKGKSTTAALTARFLATGLPGVRLGGNIGRPMLEQLERVRGDRPLVLELSSWQLEALAPHRTSPHVAVITNVLPDHLNRYPSFGAYGRVKQGIVRWQRAGDVAVLNGDDPVASGTPVPPGVARRTFSLRRTADATFRSGRFWLRVGTRHIPFARAADSRLPGRHFRAAVLAAALAADAAGADPRRFARALRSFRGLPGRLETVATRRGVRFVNDTTATAPVATLAALQSFDRPVILIAGGVDKALPFAALAAALPRHAVQLILLPGSAARKLRRLAPRTVPVSAVRDMRSAVLTAARLARRGDVVLLSPAAASFNLFRHEFDRGQAFVRAVHRLAP